MCRQLNRVNIQLQNIVIKNSMNIQKYSDGVRSICQQWCLDGSSIAFVPTMGNLHAGHLQLVEAAHQIADKVVVSIFVNPLQFGENEDFLTYPKTIEQDSEKLSSHAVDLLFLPTVEEIYPAKLSAATYVEVPSLADILCGVSRPGHFRGVATIVNKLFNIVKPSVAVFGKKDYQQLMVIKCMVSDLNMPVSIMGVDTVREQDGLAMSSRNGYLSSEERSRASIIFKTLCSARDSILSGDRQYAEIEAAMTCQLNQANLRTEYFSIRSALDLSVAELLTNDFVLLTAVQLGSTRLIDNLSFTVK